MSASFADVCVVVPAFREGKVIAATVGELRSQFPNVVVVDDGSGDSTAQEARRAGAHVVCHPINLGQGAALQTGISFAVRSGAAFVATFDADGQHHVSDLCQMVEILRREPVDIVLGSRFLGKTESMPVSRR
ncbi:MAG: glycosyltransferase family 2 protein, partial [Steroidobacteraceae bacterium]